MYVVLMSVCYHEEGRYKKRRIGNKKATEAEKSVK